MSASRVATACLCLGLVFAPMLARAQPAPTIGESSGTERPLLRLFLTDGTTLASYGEPARVGDRVVFPLPTSDAPGDPRLHLTSIPASRVDWERTERYAESVRASAYAAVQGARDYALLTADIGRALNDVALTNDPDRRLAIVEQARRMLAGWPARHYHYKADEIQQMLAILDDAIADLRTAVGVGRFDLSFVAPAAAAEAEPLLPPPTPREIIEQTLAAARLSESPAERTSLMFVALSGIERDAERLPSDWRTHTRAAIESVIAAERRTDRQYRVLTTRAIGLAEARARSADVRGLERLLAEIHRQDELLGGKRPDAIGGLMSTVKDRIDAARRLSLARERWSIRMPELRKFEAVLDAPAGRLARLTQALEDIRAMVASAPAALWSVERTAIDVLELVSPLAPPDELRAAHTLLVSAAQLATSAARIRREAALSGDLSRAWDASSAAAGALMLTARARSELEAALSLPQLAQ